VEWCGSQLGLFELEQVRQRLRRLALSLGFAAASLCFGQEQSEANFQL
jgi:hypothetical protein